MQDSQPPEKKSHKRANKNAIEKTHVEAKQFSVQLQDWLDSDSPKTVSGLEDVFEQKSFALTFLVLMAIPALPLPTGGVTHVFEVITMLLAVELIAQRRSIWLPKRWRHKELGNIMLAKALPRLIKMVKKVERISRPRLTNYLDTKFSSTIFGALVFALAAVAFLAPPFSGLDTLPSMGVLGISLGVILGDFIVVCVGVFIGALGAFLSIGFGAVIVDLIKGLFN